MSSVFAVDPQPVAGLATDEDRLVRLAVELGARVVGGPLAPAELALAERVLDVAPAPAPSELSGARSGILAGDDPLGERLYALRAAEVRRQDGAVYTPPELVAPMVEWTLGQNPLRVVDAGAGSGRFSALVARRAPAVHVVAIDSDPVATLMSRAVLAAIGHERATCSAATTRVFNCRRPRGAPRSSGTRPTFATMS